MNQREITRPTPLLNHHGALLQPGWARHMLYRYNHAMVQAGPFSLKEWDFYQIHSGDWVLQMTIGHVSYMASYSATLFNLQTGARAGVTRMKPFPLRRMAMDVDPELPHTLRGGGRGWRMCFDAGMESRRLTMTAADPAGDAEIDITLRCDPDDEKLVIATPFEKGNQFYLNCKTNFFGASGTATIGGVSVTLGENDIAVLDWGRGVWPFRHQWFWGNGARRLPDGRRFAFNLGWGFGNTACATENAFFVDGKACKLGAVAADYDPADLMKPWRFTSDDGAFDFVMQPVYDNHTQTRLAFVDNRCHQVFGSFSGTAALPDGTTVAVSEMTAFCEHAENRW